MKGHHKSRQLWKTENQGISNRAHSAIKK
uniref:Uncharacterized protein n=1 Tax=Anguilla anguilla TaxID=7936 RepID=A0A0E9PMR9_ANGAN